MITNNQRINLFNYEEDIKQSISCSQRNSPPIEMINMITIKLISGEQYDLVPDNQLFQIFFYLISQLNQSSYKDKILSISIPHYIESSLFNHFMTFLLSPENVKTDLDLTKQLMTLCFFFQAKEQMKDLISFHILPSINKESCLKIIMDYDDYSLNKTYSDLFDKMLLSAKIQAIENMFYLIQNQLDQLLNLPDELFDDILEKYYENDIMNQNDHTVIMKLMMTKRSINNDIFALLENERKRAVGKFEKTCFSDIHSTLTWKIIAENPQKGFYKESEEFIIKNVGIMLINHYDRVRDSYSLAIKITDDKDYSTISNNYQPENDDDVINDNSESNINPQFIISLLSICKIKELEHESKINFNCIYSNTQTRVLINRIENFSKKFEDNNIPFTNLFQLEFTLNIYFSISYNFSSILTYICQNFNEYLKLQSLSIISKNVLNIILRNEELNVHNEDEVLIGVMTWLNYRNNINSDVVLEVIKNINWNLLSAESLFTFITSQSKYIILSCDLQVFLSNVLNDRFKSIDFTEVNQSYYDKTQFKVKRKFMRNSNRIFNKPTDSFSLDLIMTICKSVNQLNNHIKSPSSPNFELGKDMMIDSNMSHNRAQWKESNHLIGNTIKLSFGKTNDSPLSNKSKGMLSNCHSSTTTARDNKNNSLSKRNHGLSINSLNSNNTFNKSKDDKPTNPKICFNARKNIAKDNTIKDKREAKSKSMINERKTQKKSSAYYESRYHLGNTSGLFPNYLSKYKSSSKSKLDDQCGTNNSISLNMNQKSLKTYIVKKKASIGNEGSKKESTSPYNQKYTTKNPLESKKKFMI